MTEDQMDREWIDNASYEEMLRRNRFGKSCDTIFYGKLGQYYSKVMKKKEAKLKPGEKVAIGKQIGWDS